MAKAFTSMKVSEEIAQKVRVAQARILKAYVNGKHPAPAAPFNGVTLEYVIDLAVTQLLNKMDRSAKRRPKKAPPKAPAAE